jgi:hypothetical protein
MLLAAGCASTGSTNTTSNQAAGRSPVVAASGFVRHVAPFPVSDAGGVPYAHPFIGGFDVPRPQFIDIDDDGDADLFIQERSDELMYLENIGTAAEPRFEWRTDRFEDLSIGEWNRFVDLDADGDFDLMAEAPFSYIRYYRNDGSASQPRFVLAADSLRDVEGEPVFADRQNIPSIADIDCDDRLDLFLGRVDGTITRFSMTPGRQPPRFEFVTDRFEGIEIVGQVIGGSARHGANAMAFADVDGDGDLDFFWGDYFEPGVLFVDNRGGCAGPSLRDVPRGLPGADTLTTSGYNMPVPHDADADGDIDVFIGVLGGAFNPNRTAADNFWYLERLGPDSLALRTSRYIAGIDTGSESVPALADIDGDGDIDLLVGNKIDASRLDPPQSARLYVFENQGSTTAPSFRLADTLDLARQFHYAPALGDLDGDGDVDLLLGTWNEGVLYYSNDGSSGQPRWVQDSSATVKLPRGGNATPALGDIDGDGDLDLFVGEASGEVNFFQNVGDGNGTRFELVTETFNDIDMGRRSAPTLADIDDDGDLDLLLGAEEEGLRLWRNSGTPTEPRFEEDPSFSIPLHAMAAPALADLDGDDDMDLVAGGLSGGLVYWERTQAQTRAQALEGNVPSLHATSGKRPAETRVNIAPATGWNTPMPAHARSQRALRPRR